MKTATRLSRSHRSFALILILFATTGIANAQTGFVLSRNADLSSDDRAFEQTDVLYMRVDAPHIDFADLDENEFELDPSSGGNDIHGTFTNNFDGTYSAELALDITDPSVSDWQWHAEIKDDAGNEFNMHVDITIGAAPADTTGQGGSDDQNGDDSSGSSDDSVSGDDSEHDDHGEDDDDHGDEIEIKGLVEDIGADFIVVGGTTFTVDDQTLFFDDDGMALDSAGVAVGDLVEIKGAIGADGILRAVRVKLEDEDDDEVEMTGTVDEVGAGFIVVDGMEFATSDSTTVFDNDGSPISTGDLTAGMLVEVHADVLSDGSLLATKIEVEDGIQDEVELTGAIEAISADSITVLGQTFIVPGTIVVLDDDGNEIDYSSLTVGQRVEIRGELQPGGDVVALRIKIEDAPSTTFSVVAPIEQVSAGSLKVLGVTVGMDANTVVTSSDGSMTRMNLAAGNTVSISGASSGNGTFRAGSIELQRVSILTGSVNSVSPNFVTVEGITFSVDERTLVLDETNRVVPRAALSSAGIAEVRGISEPAGRRATKVKIAALSVSTAVQEEAPATPQRFTLNDNYPNPFNPTTTITFELNKSVLGSAVELTVFDVLGRKVRTLLSASDLSGGTHTVTWNGTSDAGHPVTSGLYLYRLRVADQLQTRTMTLLK